jgi:putative peptidoglycan lipid II flippase
VSSLQAYSLGLMGFMAIKVLASAYFSRQDTRTPVRIGIIAMVVNMVFNLLLIIPLAHVGLALATSLSATVNAMLLLVGLHKRKVLVLAPEWTGYLLRVFTGAGAMTIVLLFLSPSIAQWQQWGALERCWHLAILCIAGGLSYFIVLGLLGLRLRDFHHRGEV